MGSIFYLTPATVEAGHTPQTNSNHPRPPGVAAALGHLFQKRDVPILLTSANLIAHGDFSHTLIVLHAMYRTRM